ncbi:MAG: lyase family protein [Planctomycetota bacterium]
MCALWSGSGAGASGRDDTIDAFMRGEDPELDHQLIPYDLTGTAAHVRCLGRAGVLKADDVATLTAALQQLRERYDRGEFTLRPDHEDCHTAIEEALTDAHGELGKRVHTARSRNDQVLTALRLFALDRLRAIAGGADRLAAAFEARAVEAGQLIMPGYTHGQPAMPLPVETWARSFRDALADDRLVIAAAVECLDQSPLGSAAGFGPPIPLDRAGSATDLGFARVQHNPVYCQQSRAKFEALALTACAQVCWTMAQFAADGLLFHSRAYGFIHLPDELTTGSSLMPNKRNPDVLELLRALHAHVEGHAATIRMLGVRLPSGYHRDFQATKRAFLSGLEQTAAGVEVCRRVVERLTFDADAMTAACGPEIQATARAHQLVVEQGMAFRDAYRQVKDELFGSK